jgi:hypothetical protein
MVAMGVVWLSCWVMCSTAHRARTAPGVGDKRKYTMGHVRGFLARARGGAQFKFKEGAGLWETKKIGMMPPPNFGRHLNKGRFVRTLRHLGRGPGGYEDVNGPWCPVRCVVNGHNRTRKREFCWGWCCIVDETMFTWRGTGLCRRSAARVIHTTQAGGPRMRTEDGV